jgi:hypothetical protein
MTTSLSTPVVFIVFNRPDTTRRVFESIVGARPSTLLLIADGPREGKTGETEACRQVLEIVSHVDWPCQVFKNFAAGNLGCAERVISGLDWAFSLVEEAIILEDDCLPDPSFFSFCSELLEKYRDDDRLASICGANLVERYQTASESYYFSRLGSVWGWATWKSRWQRYDRFLRNWPSLRRADALTELFDEPKYRSHWKRIFDSMYEGVGPDTWDYQWCYSTLFENMLHIVPTVNLIANIGFGPEATHTKTPDSRLLPKLKTIDFPLKHPSGMVPSRRLDSHFQQLYFLPIAQRITQKLRKIVRSSRR